MDTKALLPDRHPIRDFFIADIFDALPIKNDRHTMEHPFFSLSTKPDIREVEYDRDGIQITLSPHNRYGLPTMMDKDILLYCGSHVVAELNRNHLPSKTIRFSAHDLMVTTNRETNGKAYGLLKNAFERLKGVSITTNISTNDVKMSHGFGLIDSWKVIENSRDKKRMVKVEVTLSDWFYNSLIGREVLTINRDYFRLRKTLERRLYELARKHCGKQIKWQIGLENLHAKAGSQSPLKKFRFQLRKIIETDRIENHFPDYQIMLQDNDVVVFSQKNRAVSMQGELRLDDIPSISQDTLRKARAIVADSNTGWDFNTLHQDFTLSLMNGFKPEKANGAFINFIKKKVATAP